MKFDRHIGSTAAEVPVKFQSDRTILNTNLAASRHYEILRKDVFPDIETGPRASTQWYRPNIPEYSYFISGRAQHIVCISNTLRSRQNGRHLADDAFKRFFLMKMLEFRLKFHWSLFLRVRLTIFQHWIRSWLGADAATSHYLNQWWLDYRRIYASLGLNELMLISIGFTAITPGTHSPRMSLL